MPRISRTFFFSRETGILKNISRDTEFFGKFLLNKSPEFSGFFYMISLFLMEEFQSKKMHKSHTKPSSLNIGDHSFLEFFLAKKAKIFQNIALFLPTIKASI